MFKAKVVEENCSINELRSKIGRWMKIAKGKRLLAVVAIKKSTTLISASWLACLNLRWGWRKLRLRLRYIEWNWKQKLLYVLYSTYLPKDFLYLLQIFEPTVNRGFTFYKLCNTFLGDKMSKNTILTDMLTTATS